MNKLVAILALGVCFSNVYAKGPKKNKAEEEGFVFTTVKENPITSIKDQNQSSTCWSFSTLGFLEAELLRAGNCAGYRLRGINCRKRTQMFG